MQVTVIVCTRNRSHAIIPSLESIARALKNAMPLEAEIVVVDNASEDDTAARVTAWAENCDIPVNLVHETRKGLSKARNCGLRTARGDLLVFTDDDCHLGEDYIKNAIRHDAQDRVAVMRGGRVELGDPSDLPLTIKTEAEKKRWQRDWHSARNENLGNTLLGCNMVMRRALVEKVGLFDERLGAGSPIPGGEDTDYIFRAYNIGFAIEYVPDLIVDHFHGRKTQKEAYELLKNYSVGGGALYAKHLFVHFNHCRQFVWDLKSMVREVVPGKNLFMPEIGFSLKDKIFYNIKGFFMYALITTYGLLNPLQKPVHRIESTHADEHEVQEESEEVTSGIPR